MGTPGEFLIRRLEVHAPALAALLRHRDSVARLLIELPREVPLEAIAADATSHEIWENVGQYFLVEDRLHEAIAVFWAFYQQMLLAQVRAGRRLHKGMPLVWIADCYARLGFPVHAKRYLMLTLCEDDRPCDCVAVACGSF